MLVFAAAFWAMISTPDRALANAVPSSEAELSAQPYTAETLSSSSVAGLSGQDLACLHSALPDYQNFTSLPPPLNVADSDPAAPVIQLSSTALVVSLPPILSTASLYGQAALINLDNEKVAATNTLYLVPCNPTKIFAVFDFHNNKVLGLFIVDVRFWADSLLVFESKTKVMLAESNLGTIIGNSMSAAEEKTIASGGGEDVLQTASGGGTNHSVAGSEVGACGALNQRTTATHLFSGLLALALCFAAALSLSLQKRKAFK